VSLCRSHTPRGIQDTLKVFWLLFSLHIFFLEAILLGNCMLLDIIRSHYILINILNLCVLVDFTDTLSRATLTETVTFLYNSGFNSLRNKSFFRDVITSS